MVLQIGQPMRPMNSGLRLLSEFSLKKVFQIILWQDNDEREFTAKFRELQLSTAQLSFIKCKLIDPAAPRQHFVSQANLRQKPKCTPVKNAGMAVCGGLLLFVNDLHMKAVFGQC
jgi:hypothetical protein